MKVNLATAVFGGRTGELDALKTELKHARKSTTSGLVTAMVSSSRMLKILASNMKKAAKGATSPLRMLTMLGAGMGGFFEKIVNPLNKSPARHMHYLEEQLRRANRLTCQPGSGCRSEEGQRVSRLSQ
eukprot:GSA25T00006868001.1